MGRRNYEHWTARDWRAAGGTIEAMRLQGWSVVAVCGACDLVMAVNLDHLVKLCGPELSLWNRRARCRRARCQGAVRFYGKPLQLYDHIVLIAGAPDLGTSTASPTESAEPGYRPVDHTRAYKIRLP